jgi:hypothetical protein
MREELVVTFHTCNLAQLCPANVTAMHPNKNLSAFEVRNLKLIDGKRGFRFSSMAAFINVVGIG